MTRLENRMSKSRRGPAPIPGAPVAIRIESCPQEGKATVRFLGPYYGTFTHFQKKGSVPCAGDAGECPASLHKNRKIWKGFAAAEFYRGGAYDDWCPCVWEVTESLNEVLDGISLRGTVWQISRVPGDCGKPEVSAILVATVDERSIRSAFDVLPAVSRIYGFLPMQWGVKSHIPPRLRLEPSKGEAPPNVAPSQASGKKGTEARSPEETARIKAMLEEGRKVFGRSAAEVVPINGHVHEGNGKGVHS
jgi:hypothetical protein